jgi:uncharacterized membrane protein
MFDKAWLNAQQKEMIISSIKAAELNTSGEIRVHIENHCKIDVLDCATHWFAKLKMHQTEGRNGVLFYLAIKDRKFAILGDAGINQKVPSDFWDSIKNQMQEEFRQNRFVEGLCLGIELSGHQLKQHFPLQINDKNELSNEISFA